MKHVSFLKEELRCIICEPGKPFRYGVCKKCFYEHYCSFCKTLVRKEACPGHSVTTPTTNRFMEDRQFTNELMFEIQQQ